MSEIILFLIPVVGTAIAVGCDLRSREIPDWVPIVIVLLIPLQFVVSDHSIAWWQHVAGAIVALTIGLIVGYGDRFGGGDIKLFAALGGWFGLFAVVPLALWISIAGLPLAFWAAARKQGDFAYAPAIFAGVCVHAFVPDLLGRIAF